MSDFRYSGISNKVSTSLHMAIQNGDAVTDNDIRKENINTKDKNGMLPIHVACTIGSSVVVKKLLNHGASINSLTQLKYRPLHLAVEKGHKEVIELLLREGADINANDNNAKLTPLHIAVRAGLLKTVKQLLSRGASVSVTDLFTNTVLHIAVEQEFIEIVEILLNHNANVHAKGQDNSTPLHVSDNVKISKMLLDKGADVNAKNRWKETPLHKRKSIEATKFLLEYEVDVNSVNFCGETALFGYTDETIVRMIKKGADVDVRKRFGRTVRHENVEMNRVTIVQLLLDYEADVTMEDNNGVTPLHLSRNETISRMLISKGANVNAKSKLGKSPIHYAAAEGCNELVKVLLEYGVDPNCKDLYGRTPLHIAASNRYYDVTEILLNNGADVNDEDDNGFSLLYQAILNGFTDFTSLLLQYDPNLDDRVVFEIGKVHKFNRGYPPSMSTREQCLIAIEKHFISLIALELDRGLPRIEGYLRWMRDFDAQKTRRFYDSCKTQVDLMTQEKIGNTRVSFRNILTRNIHRVATYASNKSIVEAIELGEYKEKYPVYAKRIETKFKMAQKLDFLLKANERSIISLNGRVCSIISYNLPDIVIEKILSYLSYRDLRMLIQASSNATNAQCKT